MLAIARLRKEANRLRSKGWSPKAIARELDLFSRYRPELKNGIITVKCGAYGKAVIVNFNKK